jgi:hypothetical protein
VGVKNKGVTNGGLETQFPQFELIGVHILNRSPNEIRCVALQLYVLRLCELNLVFKHQPGLISSDYPRVSNASAVGISEVDVVG